jgi:hypothetical protein
MVWAEAKRKIFDTASPATYTAPSGLSSGFSGVIAFTPSAFNDNALIFIGGTHYLRAYVNDVPAAVQVQLATVNGLDVNTSVPGLRLGEVNVLAFRVFPNDVAVSLNGGALVTDTSAVVPASLPQVILGSFGGLQPLMGEVVYAGLSLTKPSDADLRALASPNV